MLVSGHTTNFHVRPQQLPFEETFEDSEGSFPLWTCILHTAVDRRLRCVVVSLPQRVR